jgi:phosphohistidine phosphatase SixA
MPRTTALPWNWLAASLVLTVCVAASGRPAAAQDVWELMKSPRHAALMRHAHAPGTGEDPPGIDLKNCALQRNLDETGRAQARRAGDEFRAHGIRNVRMVASQFCRAIDTARLMKLGPVQQLPLLNYLNFNDPKLDDIVSRTKDFLKRQPANQLTLLVTHISNVKALTSVTPQSGEIVVVRVDPAGGLTVVGQIAAR